MGEQHSRQEILAVMKEVPIIAVSTLAGGIPRIRMMHYAYDDSFNIYLATFKGESKTIQLAENPAISLLVHYSGASINEDKEIEIIGKALFIRDQKERAQALELTAKRSPVVKNLTDAGNGDYLECLKVVPETVRFRIFGEIVQGTPPTVIEFS